MRRYKIQTWLIFVIVAFAVAATLLSRRSKLSELVSTSIVNRNTTNNVKSIANTQLRNKADTPLFISKGISSINYLTKEETAVMKGKDNIYYWKPPIVIESYRLLFFTNAKVSCTVFKMLFRRMMGEKDWKTVDRGKALHDYRKNGLKYLNDYPKEIAQEWMASPNWTRAIFIRDPKQRLLSAFLNKAEGKHTYFKSHCCDFQPTEEKKKDCKERSNTFSGFIDAAKYCGDGHWIPQTTRVDLKWWRYINFFGFFDYLADDTKTLLEHIGDDAWEKYGKSGWGTYGNESIYSNQAKPFHATNAGDQLDMYYTIDLEKKVDLLYKNDYQMFNFT